MREAGVRGQGSGVRGRGQGLTHRSGISYGTEPHLAALYEAANLRGWYFADHAEPMARAVRRLPELPFADHPGERFIYGLSTDVLGVLLERVTGDSLDEILRTRILEPLGMRDAHFYLPPEKRHRLAAVHGLDQRGLLARAPATRSRGHASSRSSSWRPCSSTRAAAAMWRPGTASARTG